MNSITRSVVNGKHELDGPRLTVEYDKIQREFQIRTGNSTVILLDHDDMQNLIWFAGEVRKWQEEYDCEP